MLDSSGGSLENGNHDWWSLFVATVREMCRLPSARSQRPRHSLEYSLQETTTAESHHGLQVGSLCGVDGVLGGICLALHAVRTSSLRVHKQL